MISVSGIPNIPAGKQLFLIREIKVRIHDLTEQHSNLITRGAETGDVELTAKAYRDLLKILGRDYRDLFCRT